VSGDGEPHESAGPPAIQQLHRQRSVSAITCEMSQFGAGIHQNFRRFYGRMIQELPHWALQKLGYLLTSLTRPSSQDAAAEPENPNGIGGGTQHMTPARCAAAYPCSVPQVFVDDILAAITTVLDEGILEAAPGFDWLQRMAARNEWNICADEVTAMTKAAHGKSVTHVHAVNPARPWPAGDRLVGQCLWAARRRARRRRWPGSPTCGRARNAILCVRCRQAAGDRDLPLTIDPRRRWLSDPRGK